MGLLKNSALAALFAIVGRAFRDSWIAGALSRFLNHDGLVISKVSESRLNDFAVKVFDIIPGLVRGFYVRHSGLCDTSLTVRFLRAYGEAEYAAVSWLAAAVLLLPESRWKTMYPLIGFGLLILLHWVLLGLNPASYTPGKRKLTNGWALLFAVSCVISVVFSYNPKVSLEMLPRYVSCLMALYLFTSIEWTAEKLRRVVDFIIVCMILLSLYGIYQRFSGLTVRRSEVDIARNPYITARIFSLYDNANAFGFLLCLLLPLSFISAIYGPELRFFGSRLVSRRVISAAAFVIGSAALILTYSRGAWIAFAAGLFFFAALKKPKLIPIFIVLILVALPFIPNSVFFRLLTIFTGDTSLQTRTDIWSAVLKIFIRSPVYGAGLGLENSANYVINNGLFQPKIRNYYIHAHNFAFQVVAEMGIIGVISFFGMAFSILKKALRKTNNPLIAGCSMSLISIFVCGIGDHPISYPRMMLVFWIFLGITVAAGQYTCNNPQKKVPQVSSGGRKRNIKAAEV
ncbi:MAG: O-antigen ligase family protein [Oscillospiraceae bacterium]|jgi:O-antigen ligase|nr:O-antigen ligase family protein [Oscillospiraceae bacterium]